jgi:transcriptional/translational regulatory protein YebC/TACO1
MNARLSAALDRARKESVSKDAIERAVKQASGQGDDKSVLDHVVFEGYAPFKVPVVVEAYTDNMNRTSPEIRALFNKKGQLGAAGSNKFLFEHVGIVEAYHSDLGVDKEAAAIEAGANEFRELSPQENDDIPENVAGTRFVCERSDVHGVSQWLKNNSWTVVTAEIGFLAKQYVDLTDEQRAEVGDFLQALDDHDDVHRVWAAIK